MASVHTPTLGVGAVRLPFRNLVARIRDWNDARRTYKALSQLSAYQLDDIGLVPGDIDRIANRGF